MTQDRVGDSVSGWRRVKQTVIISENITERYGASSFPHSEREMGKSGEGRDEGKYCGCGGRRAGGHRGPPLQTTYVTRRRGRPLCRPVVGVCTSVVPLIRHGCAMPPSPWQGEGIGQANLAFSTQGGRCPRRGRMRVSFVGCIRRRRATEDSGPYGRDSSHSVGADVPIRPESPRRFAALPPFTRGAAVTHH